MTTDERVSRFAIEYSASSGHGAVSFCGARVLFTADLEATEALRARLVAALFDDLTTAGFMRLIVKMT